MKIALTGAGHFVGARLIESFRLGGGPTLAAVVPHPADFTAAARFAVDLRVADFLDPDSLARSFTGCSAVVHVSPLVHSEARRVVAALCRAAARSAVKRIVLVSSADVHGYAPRINTDEKSPLHTRHETEAINALVSAERQFATECRQLGLVSYVLRPGFLYGPRAPATAALASALVQERVTLRPSANGPANCVYLDNLIAAIRLTLKTKSASGSAFLITDNEAVTWREFFDAAAAELGAPLAPNHPAALAETPSVIPGFPPEFALRERSTWRASSAFATAQLGYQPAVTFAEGMHRSCAWWRFAQGEFSTAA